LSGFGVEERKNELLSKLSEITNLAKPTERKRVMSLVHSELKPSTEKAEQHSSGPVMSPIRAHSVQLSEQTSFVSLTSGPTAPRACPSLPLLPFCRARASEAGKGIDLVRGGEGGEVLDGFDSDHGVQLYQIES
jgi:hypothetical protein